MERTRALMPWEIMTITPEEEQVMYRDWGLYFTTQQKLDMASKYYDKSLELNEHDYQALYFRSKCKRSRANPKSAYVDALNAMDKTELFKSAVHLELCDALYEMNEFENNIVELKNGLRSYSGSTISSFVKRLCVVEETFHSTLGPSLKPFIMKYKNLFSKVHALYLEKIRVDDRPLWKKLKAEGKCDILSILEKEEELLSPREIMRRKRAHKIYIQTYMALNWKDVLFLKDLSESSNFLLPYAKESTPVLKQLIQSKYNIVTTFIKMLHSRTPLYNAEYVNFPNRKVRQEHHEAQLYRIQRQTGRNMYNVLRNIRRLRAEGKLKELIKYVEEIMGDYVVVKTHRVMPWKLEFTFEVYNTLALAFADTLKIPKNFRSFHSPEHFRNVLLKCPNITKEPPAQFSLGSRKNFEDVEAAAERAYDKYKQYQNRLERRMYFAKYGIEKCYLYHEIARSHLKEHHFDECCSVARKGIKAGELHKSPLWAFLSSILIVKAHAALGKDNHEREALLKSAELVGRLKNDRLSIFTFVCLRLNNIVLTAKKRHSIEERTKPSIYSRKSRGNLLKSSFSNNSATLQAEQQEERGTYNPDNFQSLLQAAKTELKADQMAEEKAEQKAEQKTARKSDQKVEETVEKKKKTVKIENKDEPKADESDQKKGKNTLK